MASGMLTFQYKTCFTSINQSQACGMCSTNNKLLTLLLHFKSRSKACSSSLIMDFSLAWCNQSLPGYNGKLDVCGPKSLRYPAVAALGLTVWVMKPWVSCSAMYSATLGTP